MEQCNPAAKRCLTMWRSTPVHDGVGLSLAQANSNPNTACGGTDVEVACPGGELAFIMRMVEDSVRLGGRVHW
jgi:23S rRNA A1618 N6-methylase RlmF